MKNKKTIWVFFFYKYGKFWSILRDKKVDLKPLFSEEWLPIRFVKNRLNINFLLWFRRKWEIHLDLFLLYHLASLCKFCNCNLSHLLTFDIIGIDAKLHKYVSSVRIQIINSKIHNNMMAQYFNQKFYSIY